MAAGNFRWSAGDSCVQVTSRQNGSVETLPRPGMRLALRLSPRSLIEQDQDLPGSMATPAVAKHFFASSSSLRCPRARSGGGQFARHRDARQFRRRAACDQALIVSLALLLTQ